MPGFLFDTSVWLAVTFPTHERHALCLDSLDKATESSPAIFCRATEQRFLRLATTPRLMAHYGALGVTNRSAAAMVKSLLARPNVRFWDEPPGTADLWYRLAVLDSASPKVWMDAYLAAFAICGGLRLVTLDSGFKVYEAHKLEMVLVGR